MTTLMMEQVSKEYDDGGKASKVCLYAIKNVDGGDDFNFGEDFSVIKRAIGLAATRDSAGVATVAGTVVTFPAGLTDDAVWLLVFGVDNYGP
jgi:hypothetical protein